MPTMGSSAEASESAGKDTHAGSTVELRVRRPDCLIVNRPNLTTTGTAVWLQLHIRS